MGEVASWHAELLAAGWLPPGTPPPTVNVEAGSVIWPDVPLENGFAPMTQRLTGAGWLSPDDAAKLRARIGLAELGKKAQRRVDQDYLAAGWLPPEEAEKLRREIDLLTTANEAYWRAQKALDEILGPNEEDGAGGGLVAEIWLLAELRNAAQLEARSERRQRHRYKDVIDAARAWRRWFGDYHNDAHDEEIALLDAVDALDADAPEEGTQP